jgi:signal transduction histidine kinase
MKDITLVEAQFHILESKDESELYREAVKYAQILSNAVTGSVYIKNNSTYAFEKKYSTVQEISKFLPRKDGYLDIALSKNVPHIVSAKEMTPFRPEFNSNGITYVIFLPISYKKNKIAVMSLRCSQQKKPTKKLLNQLLLLGSFISIHYQNIVLSKNLQCALEYRDTFISLVSHELRTPVTIILTYAQLLKRFIKNKKGEEVHLIEQLNKHVIHLKNLTNELLDIKNIAKGRLIYINKKLKVKEFFINIVESFEVAYPIRNLDSSIDIEDNRYILGDEGKLFQAFMNLLSNAVKFSDNLSIVHITVTTSKNNIVCTIKDEGIGIEEKQISHIFDRFYRGNKKNTEGLGLGLYLVNDVFKEHSITISTKSVVNSGTEFTVLIPIH